MTTSTLPTSITDPYVQWLDAATRMEAEAAPTTLRGLAIPAVIVLALAALVLFA